jgi:hypothetical protein
MSESNSNDDIWPEDVLREQISIFINALFDPEDGYIEALGQISEVDIEKRTFTLSNGKSYYIGLVPTTGSSTDHCLPL